MQIKEINQKVYCPKELANGVFGKGEKISDYKKSFRQCFDHNGNLQIEYTFMESFTGISKYVYNQQGLATEVAIYRDSFDKLIQNFYFVYDDSNRLVEDGMLLPSDLSVEHNYFRYLYDKQNRLYCKEEYVSGKLDTITTFFYEDITNKVIERKHSVDDYVISAKETIFTFFNKVLAIRNYNIFGEVSEINNYKYNEKQQLIEDKISHLILDTQQTTFYKYNTFNKLICKKVIFIAFERIVKEEMVYFEYDEYSQWVSQKYYKNGDLIEVIERDIEYYNI